MGRVERQLDPLAGPVQQFAWDLRQLREAAGRPSYRELGVRVHYSASMLSEAAAGQTMPSLAVTRAYVQGCGGDVRDWERRWHRLSSELARSAVIADADAEPPYRGLAPYRAEDAPRFFGREDLVRDLLERVADTPVLAVVGASGSGKSSLLQAGLLPVLTGKAQVFTPGADPMRALAVASAALGLPPDLLLSDLLPSELPVPEVLPSTAGLPMLVVDQFEEVFTHCPEPEVRARFIDTLVGLADPRAPRVRVVLGLRADFYAHCLRHPTLVPVLRDSQLVVGPLDEEALRAVVTGPARQSGCRVDPALVDTIVADAAARQGTLPLVSHALLETWRRRQGRTLTLSGYRQAGGLAEAIARTAEDAYAQLSPEGREIARDLFLRLTALGEGTEDTRRRMPYAELPEGPAVRALLDELARARLVTCDQDDVSVAHEALIRSWPRLRDWLATDRELLQEHRRLTEAGSEWEQHGRDEAFLYRGTRLAAWDERPVDRLNRTERDFLAASRRDADRATAARRRRTRWVISGLSATVLVVTALGAVSAVQARRAADERDIALANELAADAQNVRTIQPDLELLLARKAMATRRTGLAQAALRQAVVDSRIRLVLPAGQGHVFGVAYRPDGRELATSGADGTVRVWQVGADGLVHGAARRLPGHHGEVWSPEFSPDGRLLAACGIDGTVTVWDLTSPGTTPRYLTGHTGKVWNVAFRPDGRELASTSDDGTVRLWDPVTGRQLRTVVHTATRQLGVAYSPDGKRLAASDGDGVIRVWDAAGASPPVAVLRGHTNSVENLVFTPDSRALVSASTDGTARVWHPGTEQAPVVLRGDGAGTVETVAVSPDGYRVATGGSDGTVRVFNVDGGSDPLVLAGHEGTVWSITFSPDGRRLATGSGDTTARIWDPAYPGDPKVLRAATGPLWTVAASPNGRELVSGGDDTVVRVWHSDGSGAPLELRGNTSAVLSVAVSRDGTRVASGGGDGTVRVWDIGGGHPQRFDDPAARAVWGVTFLPDGRHLAAAEESGRIRVWDLSRGTFVDLTGHVGPVRSVTASPDRVHLASAGADGTVRVWDLRTDHAVVLPGSGPGMVWQAAFSPDGSQLAGGGDDGTVRIWNVSDGGAPRVLRGHRGSVWNIAYSRDGRILASSGADGGLRLWEVGSGTALASFSGYGSPVEQAVFGPGTSWLATVHDDGSLRVSACDVCRSIGQVEAEASGLVTRDFTTEERRRYFPADSLLSAMVT